MKKAVTPSCAPRTAVAYARYSSAGQRDVSIEQQLSDIRAFAKREGFTLVHEYADHARSGFKNTSARTAFQTMMSAAESGAFDTLIVWKVDRFGRNREESAVFKGRLRRRGVRVLYAMEPIPEGSAGVLLEGMLEATAEWYSRTLSENVTRGMTDNAHRCLYNGTRILGYTRGPDGRYALVPDEAAVVRNI
ncbi:MAG: recombinase family protein, partial [Clostridia bacterium]|nr:recombinase family protein [Clostridia bacterium]